MHAIWAAIAERGATNWDHEWPTRAEAVPWVAGGNKGVIRVGNQLRACLDLYREECDALKRAVSEACERVTAPDDLHPASDIAAHILDPVTAKAATAMADLLRRGQHMMANPMMMRAGHAPLIFGAGANTRQKMHAVTAKEIAALIQIAHSNAITRAQEKDRSEQREEDKIAREKRDSKIRNWFMGLQSSTIIFAAVTGTITFLSHSFSWPAVTAFALTIAAAIGAFVTNMMHRHDESGP